MINGKTVTKSKHSQFRSQLLCQNEETACQHYLFAFEVREEFLHGLIPRLRMEEKTCCSDRGTRLLTHSPGAGISALLLITSLYALVP